MDDIYICMNCNAEYDGYHTLKHYSEDSGGFCRECDSSLVYSIDEIEEEEYE